MRVAMVIQSFRPVLGGAQRQVEQLAPLLAARGAEVHVVTRRPPGRAAREEIPGAVVHRTAGPSAGRGAGAAYTAGAVAKLLALRPDVIHAHDLLSPATAALMAAAPLRAPVVVKILSAGEGGDADRLAHKALGRQRLALAGRRVGAFVCLSEQVEDELREGGIPADRLVRIANGVDTEHFRPPGDEDERAAARAALGVRGEGPLAVYCGRFAPVKRTDVLLEAVARTRLSLALAGEGETESALRERASRPDLAGRVTVLPTVADTAPLLRAADMYVSASVTEGMSGSVLEAMAAGLPVVASPASGMPELLGDSEGLARDASTEALTAVLSRAERDAAWRAAEGARNRDVAVERFALEAVADRLMSLYRSLRT